VNRAAETLDLSGVPCPANAARAVLKLEGMDPGSLLALILDDGEPIANVPAALAEQGHAVVEKTRLGGRWRLVVRKEA
jgi:TusA-related sulfurtransferase